MTALLEAQNLVKVFKSGSVLRGFRETRALDDVSLRIEEGEVVALIGESGSGKTTLGKVLLRLTPVDAGSARFAGDDLFALRGKALREKRREFQMVFQNQAANLHPKMTATQMLDESLRLHRPDLDAAGRAERTAQLLDRVSLTDRADQRPGSLSGGERRRVGLARILATKPRLIVADEPTSGLDAAIKLQIIALLKELKDDRLTYLLISHDLGLVRRIADRVVVMLKGQVVERVSVHGLDNSDFNHPYTARLMRAADLDQDRTSRARPAPGEVGGASGCVYSEDCQTARELGILARCQGARPPEVELETGHWVACFGPTVSAEAN